MCLYHSRSTYKIDNLEQFKKSGEFLEHQLDMVCSTKNAFLPKCAFNEALNNAVDHGEFPINIDFNNLTSDQLLIKITDSGKGFSVHEKIELIRKKGVDQLLEDGLYNERGRGIYIMYKAVSKVSFNDKGNEVSLVISNS